LIKIKGAYRQMDTQRDSKVISHASFLFFFQNKVVRLNVNKDRIPALEASTEKGNKTAKTE
jgi:hypothetical protein